MWPPLALLYPALARSALQYRADRLPGARIKARAAGYNLVLDTAAESANRTPVVLFQSGLEDLTQSVLKKINETAPPGALDSTGATGTK
jgi:hypothetical protein